MKLLRWKARLSVLWVFIAIVAVVLTLLPAGCSYGDETNYDPAWSPDGSQIAITSGGTGGG